MDEKDILIEKQAAEIKQLKEIIKQLEERIAQLEKDSSNSSKPPSSDIVKPKKSTRKAARKKRKRGGQFGHRKFTRQPFEPEQVDEVIEYEFKEKDAAGLTPLNDWFVVQQLTLAKKMYTVTEHRGRKYLDPATGQRHIAPLPEVIRQGGLLGADMTAWVAFLKGACHLSYTTIQMVFKTLFHLDISRGMLCKATQKVSNAIEPAYNHLADRLPNEPRVNVDETGHHDDGKLHWTWCFDTPQYSVFKIDTSRGSGVLEAVLGNHFEGIIGADYWGAYRKYARLFDVRVQYCMAHLIREIRFLAEHSVHKLSRWGNELLDWLKKLFDTWHRQPALTEKGWRRSMKRIQADFLKQIRRPPNHQLAKKLARRFKGEAAADYFRFLTEPDVEPTNNGTERQIRPVVIDRRITQGTRGQAGMRWCERIWTTIATCKKQNRNAFEFIHSSLMAYWTNSSYPELL